MKKNYIKVGMIIIIMLTFFGGIYDVKATDEIDKKETPFSCKWPPKDKNPILGFIDFTSHSGVKKESQVDEDDVGKATNNIMNNKQYYSGINDSSSYKVLKIKHVNGFGRAGFYTCGVYFYINGNLDCDYSYGSTVKDVCNAFAGNVSVGDGDNSYPLVITAGTSSAFYFSADSLWSGDNARIQCGKDCKVYYLTRPDYYKDIYNDFHSTLKGSMVDSDTRKVYNELNNVFNMPNITNDDYSVTFNSKMNSMKKTTNYKSYKNHNRDSISAMSYDQLNNLYNTFVSDIATYKNVINSLNKVNDIFTEDSFESAVMEIKSELGKNYYGLEIKKLVALTGDTGNKAMWSDIYGFKNFTYKGELVSFDKEYAMIFENGTVDSPVTYDGNSVSFDYNNTITNKLTKGGISEAKNEMKKAYNEYYRYLKYAVDLKCDGSKEEYCNEETNTTTGFAIFAYYLKRVSQDDVQTPLAKMYELSGYAQKLASIKGWTDLADKFEKLMDDELIDLIDNADVLVNNFTVLITKFDDFKLDIKMGDEGELECSTYISEELGNMLSFVYFIGEVFCAVIIVVLGMLDFTKATANSDADALKKSWSRIIKRLIAFGILIILPAMLKWILVDIFEVKGIDPTNPICVNTNDI